MDRRPTCRECADSGAVYFVGELYCGRCALERLIGALTAEIADDAVDEMATVSPVLVER